MFETISDLEIKNFLERRHQISKNKKWGFDLEEKEFIKGMVLLNPQSYGSRIEKYIQTKLDWEKINASLNEGDLKSKSDKNLELKASILTPNNNNLNLVQIRLFHDVDYYLCIAYDLRNLPEYKKYMFLLTHDEMELETKTACAAHGTKDSNLLNENIELRMSLVCEENNEVFKRWKKLYLVENYEVLNERV